MNILWVGVVVIVLIYTVNYLVGCGVGVDENDENYSPYNGNTW